MRKIITDTKMEDRSIKEFDDKYEIYKNISKVHNPLTEFLSSDYIYAHLDEKDREYVISMINCAYMAKKIYTAAGQVCLEKWGPVEGERLKKFFNEEAVSIFNLFMIESNAIVILRRNDEKNFILKLLCEQFGEPKKEENIEPAGFIDKMKSLMKREDANNQQTI